MDKDLMYDTIVKQSDGEKVHFIGWLYKETSDELIFYTKTRVLTFYKSYTMSYSVKTSGKEGE